MEINDPRADTGVTIEDGVLKQKQDRRSERINLSDSLKVKWSEDTDYTHISPTVLLILSVTPPLTFLFPVLALMLTGGQIPIIVASIFGIIGLFSVGLFCYGIYRFENPEYEYPECGTVYVKSNGVEIKIYSTEPRELANRLS